MISSAAVTSDASVEITNGLNDNNAGIVTKLLLSSYVQSGCTPQPTHTLSGVAAAFTLAQFDPAVVLDTQIPAGLLEIFATFTSCVALLYNVSQ